MEGAAILRSSAPGCLGQRVVMPLHLGQEHAVFNVWATFSTTGLDLSAKPAVIRSFLRGRLELVRDPLNKSREPARHGTGCRTRRHLLSIAALLTANGNAVMRPLRGCDGRGDLFRGSLVRWSPEYRASARQMMLSILACTSSSSTSGKGSSRFSSIRAFTAAQKRASASASTSLGNICAFFIAIAEPSITVTSVPAVPLHSPQQKTGHPTPTQGRE